MSENIAVQMSDLGFTKSSAPPVGNGKFLYGAIFLSGDGSLRKSDFDYLNLIQNYKQYSLNIELS